MNKKKLYIGSSGIIRSGKNLFCDIAAKQLKEKYGLTTATYALAAELKKECAPFVMEKFGLDTFSEVTEEKNIFRPLLIWYGVEKRKQSKGRHWINLLNKTINRDDSDVIFISDVRFAEFSNDEVYWLKDELNGKLVHVSKFKIVDNKRFFPEAPNPAEAENDPKVKRNADYLLEWRDVGGTEQLTDEYLNLKVAECLESILK